MVATAGNMQLVEILDDMARAMPEKSQIPWYNNKACRFIYNTTGPKLVERTLEEQGYAPHVTVFSMCRPVPNLLRYLSLDDTGRVICHLDWIDKYDVFSAFSMSYRTPRPQSLPRLANQPDPEAKKRRRYYCKTNPVTGVNQQTIAGSVPQPSDVDGDDAPTVMQT